LKEADDERLAALVKPFLEQDGCDVTQGPALARVVALLKERASTVVELADAAVYFYRAIDPSEELLAQHLTAELVPVVAELRERFVSIDWERARINETIKAIVAEHKLKLPKIAMPLRVLATGTAQTPSIDATLELIGKHEVLARMQRHLPRPGL
jgi:glutamyl-tRNA synthetase